MSVIYTIGYEGTDIDRFIATLKATGVKRVADVRAVPISRKKGFSKNKLCARLEAEGINYVHYVNLGDPKPGRDAARAGQYSHFRAIYTKHLDSEDAQASLKELLDVAGEKPTCLLCFERDPVTCHRSMVAEEMISSGFEVFDLYGDDPDRYVRNASRCRITILVKALPQPSKTHGETVCCAGITAQGEWKRLFPVRFRHLSGDSSFSRWDWVKFRHTRPTRDDRSESCRVHEESLQRDGKLSKRNQGTFLNPHVLPSINEAVSRGQSLALIRPRNTRFIWRRKTTPEIQAEKERFERAARQTSLFDKELAALDPTPFEFRFRFEDDVAHDFENGDWEAHAMFYNAQKKLGMTQQEALDWMEHRFNDEYPTKGMLFAVGNQAKWRHVWQLLGVLRVDPPSDADLAQSSLF